VGSIDTSAASAWLNSARPGTREAGTVTVLAVTVLAVTVLAVMVLAGDGAGRRRLGGFP